MRTFVKNNIQSNMVVCDYDPRTREDYAETAKFKASPDNTARLSSHDTPTQKTQYCKYRTRN